MECPRVRWIAAAALGLGLAAGGCSVEEIDPESFMPLGMPRPFSTEPGAEPLLTAITRTAAIHIPGIEGAPAPLGREITGSVAQAAMALDIIVLERPAASAAVLSGTWRSETGRAAIDWRLTAPGGEEIAAFTAEAPLPKELGGTVPAAMAVRTILSGASARGLSTAIDRLQGGAGDASQPEPTARMAPRVAILPLEGAPGDGAFSVPNALAGLLRESGLRLTEDMAEADYVISGEAELIEIDAENSAIRLRWQLRDARGETVGTVGQENRVPAGLLQGDWRENAYYAALGAQEGLMPLIGRAEAMRAAADG